MPIYTPPPHPWSLSRSFDQLKKHIREQGSSCLLRCFRFGDHNFNNLISAYRVASVHPPNLLVLLIFIESLFLLVLVINIILIAWW
jgi:hypothetical protein